MSNVAAKIAHSTFYQTLGKAAAVILGLVQVALLTRYFKEFGYGQYATVTAYLGFALVIADLGLYIVTVRRISSDDREASKILSNAFSLRIVSAAIIIPLAAVVALFLPYDQTIKTGVLLAASAFAILAVNQVFVGVFQKYFANVYLTFGEIIAKGIGVLAIVVLGYLNYGILAVLASLNIAFLANVLFTMYFANKLIPFKFEIDTALWKELLKESWPVAFSVVLNLIYFKADTIILSILKGPIEVGIYSVPYKILEVTLAFPGMFVGLLMPLLSAVAFKEAGKFKTILQNGFNFLTALSLLVIVEVLLFASPIISTITRGGFEESAPVFKILIFAAGFLFIGTLFGHAVPALGLQKKMIWGYLLSAAAGVTLYFTLIPRFSYYGAAIGTLVTEFIACVFAAVLVLRQLKTGLSMSGFLKTILAAAVVLVLGQFFSGLNWIVAALLVGLIFTFCLFVFRVFTKEDLRMILPKIL